MVERQQKNFKLPAFVFELLDDYLARMNDRGAHLRHNEVAAAALLGFLENAEKDQIDLIRRIRSHDLEQLQASESAQAATEVVRRAQRSASARGRSSTGARTRRRRKTKTP